MAKQIYIDSNGNEVMLSGTINSADMLPVSVGSSTMTKAYIDNIFPKSVYIEKEWRTSHEFDAVLNSVYMLYTDSDETIMKIRIYQTGSLNKWLISGSAISNATYSNGKVTVTMATNRGLVAVRLA